MRRFLWCDRENCNGRERHQHSRIWNSPESRSERLNAWGGHDPNVWLSIGGQSVENGNAARGKRALIHAVLDTDILQPDWLRPAVARETPVKLAASRMVTPAAIKAL